MSTTLQWWGLESGGGDPITGKWFLASTVLYPLSAAILYLFGTWYFYGKFANKGRILPKILTLYNGFQVLFSWYIFTETLAAVTTSKYNLLCEPPHPVVTNNAMRLAKASWLFHVSKYIDLLDTMFILLKGNTRQITTLHLFHHSTMLLNSWIGIRHVPTGQSFSIHFLNSFVHGVMYSYYFLSSMGGWLKPYLWWKRYLTQLQIGQFILMAIHMAIGYYNDCPTPKPIVLSVLIYLAVLVILFVNFYVRNYFSKRKTL